MAYSPSGPWAAPLLDVRPGSSLTESIDDGCRKQGSSNRRPSRAQHEGAESETASWDWRGSSAIFSSLAIKIVIFSGGPHPLRPEAVAREEGAGGRGWNVDWSNKGEDKRRALSE